MNPQPLYPNPGQPQQPVPLQQRRKLTRAAFKGIFSGPTEDPELHSHKGLYRRIAMIIIGFILIGGGIWTYFMFISPTGRARFNSNQYVSALVREDVDYAAYLSSKTVDFSLIKAAAQEVKGEYSLIEETRKGNNYYFLYKLTNTNNKMARTTVIKTDKGYRISSFIFSSKPMALVPGTESRNISGGIAAANSIEGGEDVTADGVTVGDDETDSSSSSSSSSTSGTKSSGGSITKPGAGTGSSSAGSGSSSTPGKTGSTGSSGGSTGGTVTAGACLEQSNYTAVFPDAANDEGVVWGAAKPYNVQISFNLGSTSYVDSFEVGDLYAQWVAFYRAYPGKNYTIHVQGSTSTAANNPSLASQRAETSRSALARIGIPTNRLIVDAPTRVNLDDNPDQDGYVTLYVIPGPGC